jgi:hypothetical protein
MEKSDAIPSSVEEGRREWAREVMSSEKASFSRERDPKGQRRNSVRIPGDGDQRFRTIVIAIPG